MDGWMDGWITKLNVTFVQTSALIDHLIKTAMMSNSFVAQDKTVVQIEYAMWIVNNQLLNIATRTIQLVTSQHDLVFLETNIIFQ